jgi:CubicO group peptidase (beta-lactamase class C family)
MNTPNALSRPPKYQLNSLTYICHMQKFVLTFCFLLQSAVVFGQKTDTTALFAAFDKVVLSPKYKTTDPGFAVMVIKEGRILYERQRGFFDRERQIPFSPNSVVNTGSVTKQFTAMCIYLLEEQGKLSLQDSIQRFLPELPWLGHRITIKHLVSHTSGIPDHFEVANLQGNYKDAMTSPAYVLRDLKKYPVLSFPPGADFVYSNTGYMLLAMIVERASGMKMQDFAQKNIFAPLGMNNSGFFPQDTKNAPSYEWDAAKKTFKPVKTTPNAIGAVGVYSSLRDFFLWDQNFYKNKLGKRDSTLIERIQISDTLLNGSKVNYGGGLFLAPYRRWEQTVSHTGGWNGYLMDYRRFPNSEISIVVVSNNNFSKPFPIADTLSDIILKFKPYKFSHQPIEGITAAELQGVYLSDNNFVHQVVERNGHLFIVPPFSKDKGLELFFISKREDGRFSFWDEKGEKVFFELDDRGVAKGFYWEGGHFFKVQNRFYKKLEALPTLTQTQAVTGKYVSTSRKQRLKIKYSAKHGGLVLYPGFFRKYPLEPLGGNVYRVKDDTVVVRFENNAMQVGNDWVYGLWLKKK